MKWYHHSPSSSNQTSRNYSLSSFPLHSSHNPSATLINVPSKTSQVRTLLWLLSISVTDMATVTSTSPLNLGDSLPTGLPEVAHRLSLWLVLHKGPRQSFEKCSQNHDTRELKTHSRVSQYNYFLFFSFFFLNREDKGLMSLKLSSYKPTQKSRHSNRKKKQLVNIKNNSQPKYLKSLIIKEILWKCFMFSFPIIGKYGWMGIPIHC